MTKLLAVPPEDYQGKLATWLLELQIRGLWNGKGWDGDVMLTRQEYTDLLDVCEG